MTRRLTDTEACKIMIAAGAEPLVAYPGNSKPWLCKCLICDKEITPTLGNVNNQGTKPCAYCSKKKVHPDDAVKIMREAGLEPLESYPGSNVKWKCKHLNCGEIVYPMHSWILGGSGGCLKCGYVKTKEKQKFSDEEARKLFLKNGLDPQIPYPGAGKPWKSRCVKCSQIVSPTYNSIKSGTGCGVCAGKIVTEELAVKVMKKAKLKPLVPYPGSKTNWKCECLKCGKTVYPNYGDVNQGDGGCKYCGGTFVEPEDAVATMRFNNLEPLEPYKNTQTPWKCRCLKCGKTVTPRHNSVQGGSGGCKYCAKRFVDAEDAILVMRKAKLEPLEPFPGANKSWKCKCLRCGREVAPAYTTIQNGQKGCVYCGGKKVDPDEAFSLMLAADLAPLEKYQRADKPWRCTCNKCGKVVTPTYTAIRLGQGGCRYCANKGLDYNDPAYLYLMTHQSLGAHKIGVANSKTRVNRIKEHQKYGWVLFKSMDFKTGDDAFQIEQQVLSWLREKKGLGIFLSKGQLPQGGYSETVEAGEIELVTIWAKVKSLSRVSK